MTPPPARPVDAYALAWCVGVVASLVLPAEAAPTRGIALGAAVSAAAVWGVAAAVHAGRVPLPARWRRWARRPLPSGALVLLGAAVGPSLLLFLLACRRAVAVEPRRLS